MGRFVILTCCVLAACGRYGFNGQPDASQGSGGQVDSSSSSMTDSPSGAPPVDAAPTTLPCSGATTFSVGANAASAMTAAATTDGFVLIGVDGSGNLHGYSYAFQGSALVASAQDTAVGSNATGILGAVEDEGTLLVAAATGMPTATGVTLYPLVPSTMASAGAPSARAGELAVNAPIATSGTGVGIAFASIDGSASSVDARTVTTAGSDNSSVLAIVPAATGANTISIATAGTGYAAAWDETDGGVQAIGVELLNAQLAVAYGPMIVDDLNYDAYNGTITWAPTSNVYLVSWHEKNASSGDDVWVAIYDAHLTKLVAPMLIASNASNAVAASDGSGFLVAWQSGGGALGAAYVTAAGAVTLRAVPNNGTPSNWAMVTRAGQPVLVWNTTATTGVNLAFDAVCN